MRASEENVPEGSVASKRGVNGDLQNSKSRRAHANLSLFVSMWDEHCAGDRVGISIRGIQE